MEKKGESEPSAQLAEQMARTVYQLRRHKDYRETLHGADIALLGMLELSSAGEDTITPSLLSEHLQFSRSMVTSMLNILEKGGYISRSISPRDRRQVVISVTEKGHAHMERKRRTMNRVFRYLCGYLGEEDARQLIRLTQRLREAMDQYPDTLKGEETDQ